MITAKVEGKKLTIVADIDGNSTSKSGKSTVLATTGGFKAEGDIKYSLNVIKTKK